MQETQAHRYGEPWTYDEDGGSHVEDADGPVLAVMGPEDFPCFEGTPEQDAETRALYKGRAARAVACVNACAGIADPSAVAGLVATVREIVAERDIPRAVIQRLRDALFTVEVP